MPNPTAQLTPSEAWEPIPASQWDEDAARHLLQRIAFAAPPEALHAAVRDGPEMTIRNAFARMPRFPEPYLVSKLTEEGPDMMKSAYRADERERRRILQMAREKSREALADLTIKWLQLASQPQNSPAEKWLLFLQDVWVVAIEKVKNTAFVFQHQDILRREALGDYVTLAKAMVRSPAMVLYLDLQQSRREAPNENFARELFELFTLGEGHYTERDIKEAARAFTGYRLDRGAGEVRFAPFQHDRGSKTIFGSTGPYDGEDVIDLVFKQPAARTFLPTEMARFYLTEQPLDSAYVDELGRWWAGRGFDLSSLLVRFFGSRLFFAPEFRGNFIKSPIHFYLGLVQDLELDVPPLQRQVIGALRLMGQMPYNPPNVRGWVGGRNWINSATLAARRQVVESVLRPINEASLNADEQIDLAAAASEGITDFALDEGAIRHLASMPPPEAARQLAARYVPGARDPGIAGSLERFLTEPGAGSHGLEKIRMALAALLQSPSYQLC